MPVTVEIPFSRRGPTAPVAPWFQRGGKAFVAFRAQSRTAKAAPLVPSMQALVGAQRDEVMDIIAAGIETDIETHENSLYRLKPFREPTALVFLKARLDFQAATSADFATGSSEAEGFGFRGGLLVPSGSQFTGLEVVGKDDGGVSSDAGICFKTRGQ